MNKQIFKGNWEELKGKIKQQWGKLTDDDLLQIEGDHQQIVGKLMQSYGYKKEKAEEEFNSFKDKINKS